MFRSSVLYRTRTNAHTANAVRHTRLTLKYPIVKKRLSGLDHRGHARRPGHLSGGSSGGCGVDGELIHELPAE